MITPPPPPRLNKYPCVKHVAPENIHSSPHRVTGNSEGGGGGFSKAKTLKGKQEAKLDFQRGGGFKPKDPLREIYVYFMKEHKNFNEFDVDFQE